MAWSDRPYSDQGPLFRQGPASPTLWLVGLNVAISLVIWIFGGGVRGQGTAAVLDLFELKTYPAELAIWQLWRPITYQFLHADVGHLFWNMVMLWFTGKMLEEVFNAKKLVLLYLSFGLVGALANVLSAALSSGPQLPVVGASGSIIGLVVLMGFTFPKRQIIVFIIRMSCAAFAAILVALDILQVIAKSGGNTAHSVHLGGAFGGLAFAYLWPRLQVKLEEVAQKNESRQRQKQAETKAEEEAELDRILEKINQHGMAELTEAERAFLKRQSERMRPR